MKIDCRPFSHLPGENIPLPYSSKGVQIFPAAIVLLPEEKVIPLSMEGPVKDFTVTLDLERGVIFVQGIGGKGYFRYALFCVDNQVCWFQDRGEAIIFEGLKGAEGLPFAQEKERVSFGVSKALDWELVRRRADVKEILPVWFLLGQMIPSRGGIQSKSFDELFKSGFSGIFYPEKQDFLGYNQPQAGDLHWGYQKIRALLLKEESDSCAFLSELPSVCGQAVGFRTSFGTIDFEWTKGVMRTMRIVCDQSKTVAFHFPKSHRSCRLQSSANLKQELTVPCTLSLRAETQYLLSHFQK